MAWDRNLEPRPQARAWEYWSTRLKKAGEYPAGSPKTPSNRHPQRPGATVKITRRPRLTPSLKIRTI